MDVLTDEQIYVKLYDMYEKSEDRIKSDAMVSRAYIDKISSESISKKVDNQLSSIKYAISQINSRFNEHSKSYNSTKEQITVVLASYEQVLRELSEFYDGKIEQLILKKVELEASLIGSILNDQYLYDKILKKSDQKENDKTKVSLPITAVILGFIDGFNPCAMWILLFLINMLFKMKDKKKAWILGLTFLFISALVYFLSMLGINFVLGVATIIWIRTLIALFIFGAGIYNFTKYLNQRKKDVGCTVVDEKKRKNLITKMKAITTSNSFIISLFGIIILAASVNLIELACSLGFPLIFSELLAINNVGGFLKIIYLLIYILFYMIDDIVVFAISMITLEASGITNKYNKLCTLVSSVIMILMGLLLLFKPEWLMLNF